MRQTAKILEPPINKDPEKYKKMVMKILEPLKSINDLKLIEEVNKKVADEAFYKSLSKANKEHYNRFFLSYVNYLRNKYMDEKNKAPSHEEEQIFFRHAKNEVRKHFKKCGRKLIFCEPDISSDK